MATSTGQAISTTLTDVTGEIFRISPKCAEKSSNQGMLILQSVRLVPGPPENAFEPVWEIVEVTREKVDWLGVRGIPKSRTLTYDQTLENSIKASDELTLLREQFFDALRTGDVVQAKRCWDRVVGICGGPQWSQIPTYGQPEIILGVIASVARNKICVPTKFGLKDIVGLVNAMLLERVGRRAWTHLFETVAVAVSPTLIERESVQKKITRNKRETNRDMVLEVRGVFDAFFPAGAYERMKIRRLGKSD